MLVLPISCFAALVGLACIVLMTVVVERSGALFKHGHDEVSRRRSTRARERILTLYVAAVVTYVAFAGAVLYLANAAGEGGREAHSAWLVLLTIMLSVLAGTTSWSAMILTTTAR